jgi:hypothetical protein
MPHLQPDLADRFPPDPLRSSLRGASLLEVRTTAQSCMGRLLEWFRPGLVAVLDLTRAAPRTTPSETLSGHDGSFDAVVALGAMRSRRLFDALAPALLIHAMRPGGFLLLSDFVPGSGEMTRLGAVRYGTAPRLVEWVQHFRGLGLSWVRQHTGFGDAGRLIIAQSSQEIAS